MGGVRTVLVSLSADLLIFTLAGHAYLPLYLFLHSAVMVAEAGEGSYPGQATIEPASSNFCNEQGLDSETKKRKGKL